MDKKKVIRSLYSNVCSKDDLRSQLCGVHFEKERCYATDSKILVVFHEGSEKWDGKTVSLNGEELEGRYPNVDAVIPKNVLEGPRIDLNQLLMACKWHLQKEDSQDMDAIVINHKSFSIRNLMRLLTVVQSAGELEEAVLMGYEPNRSSVLKSPSLTCLLMPMIFSESDVDAERMEEGASMCMSYEAFINDYVFNSWKPKAQKDELSWL